MFQQPQNAGEFMETRLVTLPPGMHVFDGISRLLKHHITGAPVVDPERRFLGVFSEKCSMSVLAAMARSAWEDSPGITRSVRAKDFMVTDLITLSPEADVFEAINLLLDKRISGAPVLDDAGRFLGVFSEKNSMSVLISAAYDQLPTTHVSEFMNRDWDRVISAETDLFDVADKFLSTPFRRLEVVDESGVLQGQISRRDVLATEQALSRKVRHRVKSLAGEIAKKNGDAGSDGSGHAPASVGRFMDQNALTISQDLDFLGVARIFLDTPYRRLPVLQEGAVIGQISRRDVLRVANHLIEAEPSPRPKSVLYLSSLVARQDAPFG